MLCDKVQKGWCYLWLSCCSCAKYADHVHAVGWWRGDSLCAFKPYQLWLKQGYYWYRDTHFCDLVCELFFIIYYYYFQELFYCHRKYPAVFNSLLKRVTFCFCLIVTFSHCNSLKEIKFNEIKWLLGVSYKALTLYEYEADWTLGIVEK